MHIQTYLFNKNHKLNMLWVSNGDDGIGIYFDGTKQYTKEQLDLEFPTNAKKIDWENTPKGRKFKGPSVVNSHKM